MKQTVIRIFALLLAAVMVLSLGVTAFAAEKDNTEGFLQGSSDNALAEALTPASSGNSALGVFGIEATGDDIHLFLSAFLLEHEGYVYLVTNTIFKEPLLASNMTMYSSGNGGYSQKVTMVAADANFIYLSATGLEGFDCLQLASSLANGGDFYMELDGEELGKTSIDLSKMKKGTLSDNGAAVFVSDIPFYNQYAGGPLVKTGTNQVFAVGTGLKQSSADEPVLGFVSLVEAELNSKYALGTSSGSGDTTPAETEPSNNGGDSGNDDKGGNSGNDDKGDDSGDETGSSFEFKPIYLLYIAVVAVVIFLIIHANTRGNGEVAKAGTVALERTDSVQDVETLPLNPNQGTLPLDPNYNPMPVMTAWQIRAVGGSFNGQTFPISGTLRLGRAPQCQVVFPAATPGISSNHCEVAVEGGSVVLRDLGSTYGTFCKGNKLSPHTTCHLNPGDTFTMAQGQTFQLEAAGAAAPVQSEGPIAVRDSQGREYRTGSGRMAFGRAAGNKVQFSPDDKSVSSNHCVLYREGGKLYLMDVGSTNGTFLSEKERLQPNVPYRAHKGLTFFLTNRKNTFVVTEE